MRGHHFIHLILLCLLLFLGSACQHPATDPTAANKNLVQELYEAIDKNDFEKLRTLMTADFSLAYVGVPDSLDQQATIGLIQNFYKSFPDYTHQIDEMTSEADRVAVKITFRATHKGEYEGVPATGKAITYTGAHLVIVHNGKIRRVWALEDNLGLMTQLGMVLAPAQDKR